MSTLTAPQPPMSQHIAHNAACGLGEYARDLCDGCVAELAARPPEVLAWWDRAFLWLAGTPGWTLTVNGEPVECGGAG